MGDMKRQSIYAQMLALPVDDPRHQQFRQDLWIGGRDLESLYFLSILTSENWLDALSIQGFESARQGLVDYLTKNLSPRAGQFLAACRQPMDVAHSYLKYEVAKKEGWVDSTKWSKAERLMILLIEHPDWSDEQFIKALKTTPKQLQRLDPFFHVARRDAQIRATQ